MTKSTRVIALCARCFAISLLALVVSACSRTVTWEEEVPLNTRETIWIEREMRWAMLGAMGNPFDIRLRPTREQVIRFKYAGRQYRYEGRANIRWIAISPEMKPALVAKAADFGWLCTVPYYVQLVPGATGDRWTWSDRIETWLHQLPANVASVPTPAENPKRIAARHRDSMDATYQVPEGALIDPSYKEGGCVDKKLVESFPSAQVAPD